MDGQIIAFDCEGWCHDLGLRHAMAQASELPLFSFQEGHGLIDTSIRSAPSSRLQVVLTMLTCCEHAGSIAKCDVHTVSKSSSLSVSVAESAVKRIDAVLCGPEEAVHDHATSSAHSIATAFAEAITGVAAECYASA